MLTDLSSILKKAKSKSPRKLVVASADDLSVLQAIKEATFEELIQPILVGQKDKIKEISASINFDLTNIEVINTENSFYASKESVSIIKSGRADILMKGMLTTASLLKEFLHKENGLVQNSLLSHFSIMQIPTYHKLLAITDAALNIKPTFEEKIIILKNAVDVLHNLGYPCPKVAVISPMEIVNPKIESSVHAARLAQMNADDDITGCIVNGPLALDNAINKDSAIHKGIQGVVAGNADLLLLHDLDSGNILYKSINFLAHGLTAAFVTGGSVPVVLTSRADSAKSKLLSIALASVIVN